MRVIPIALAVSFLVSGSAIAQTPGAPASPSGAPAAAAQDGSSMIGKKAAENEMTAHKKNMKKQKTMADPHK